MINIINDNEYFSIFVDGKWLSPKYIKNGKLYDIENDENYISILSNIKDKVVKKFKNLQEAEKFYISQHGHKPRYRKLVNKM